MPGGSLVPRANSSSTSEHGSAAATGAGPASTAIADISADPNAADRAAIVRSFTINIFTLNG
jgi:hypothetical protein